MNMSETKEEKTPTKQTNAFDPFTLIPITSTSPRHWVLSTRTDHDDMSRRQSVLGIPGLPPTSTSSFSRTHSSNSSFSSTSTNAPNSGYLEALDESTMANRRTTMDTLTMGTRFGGEESLEAQLGRKERECEKVRRVCSSELRTTCPVS